MLGRDTLILLVGGAVFGLWFRTLPFVGYAIVARRVRWTGKLIALSVGFGLFATCERMSGHGTALSPHVVMSWGYLLFASFLVHRAVPLLRARGATSSGLLIASGTLFLVLPGILIRTPATMVLLATGFELVFKAHSYAFEQTRARQRASLADGLTFLLVNPTLVYPERGLDHGCSEWSFRGGKRVLVGLLGLLVAPIASALVSVAGPLVTASTFARWPGGAALCTGVVLTAHLFAKYLGHSSIASYQIGTMRLLGYDVPERYNYPFLARTPDELWRRWNLYLGTWLKRYAYLPLAMRYQRRVPRAWWSVGKGFALVCVFGVCGLAHEAVGYAARFTLPMGAFVGFVFYGVVLTLWLGVGQLLRQLEQRWRWTRHATWTPVKGALAWSISCATLIAFGWVALPALGGLGLNRSIAHWVAP